MDRVFSRKNWIVALVVCGGVVAPVLAQAQDRTPDARALGTTDAILDYCTRAYPQSVEKFRFQLQRLTRGASPEAVAKARASDEYRKARAAEEGFVGQVDPHNAKHICAKSLKK